MKIRLRRLRKNSGLRNLVRETALAPADLIMPYFVRPGRRQKKPISSMPGQFQWSLDTLAQEVKTLGKLDIRGILLFGIPQSKNTRGTGAYAKNGIIPQAIKAVKDAAPDLTVITDVCLCEYTNHGHCGILQKDRNGFRILNDQTLPLLVKSAVSHVNAGADVIAPSGMMDGTVKALRDALPDSPILSYAAKFASSFYGPFRYAAESPPRFGDRSTYQMDAANINEALREIHLDLNEGADIIMVKPALAYLDVLRHARDKFGCPMAAYNVSGEYAMVRAAAERGWIDEKKVTLEILTSIKRAGADFIITYSAREAAKWMR